MVFTQAHFFSLSLRLTRQNMVPVAWQPKRTPSSVFSICFLFGCTYHGQKIHRMWTWNKAIMNVRWQYWLNVFIGWQHVRYHTTDSLRRRQTRAVYNGATRWISNAPCCAFNEQLFCTHLRHMRCVSGQLQFTCHIICCTSSVKLIKRNISAQIALKGPHKKK